jgi:selenocysteine-specific elongation factor
MRQLGGSGVPDSRFVIVGTAGHIDHGKTALVQALTGKNTDRLKEERERGISIDIDFAPLSYEDGTLIGMIDVPGHERFVRNMVAGAAGIDAALLVIDINEGMKPQTHEHISVLELLGVRQGVVALTKSDLADPEWLDMARDVIRESLSDTVFSEAPMVATSTKTGAGLEELKALLRSVADAVPRRDQNGAFRLPVDKVFSIAGFGTVVSGTVWRGRVSVGDNLENLPGRKRVRVRGIQAHGKNVSSVLAGQRAALNITGVDHGELKRGYVLAAEGTLFETKLMDVRVNVLPSYDHSLKHRDRVHFHLATGEVVGRVLLLEQDELAPGDHSFAQILLEKPVVCEATDSFILRSYSPVMTLGGGHIIEPVADRLHRRKRAHILDQLAELDSGSPLQRLLVSARQGESMSVKRVVAEFGVTEEEADSLLRRAEGEGHLLSLPSGWFARETVAQALQTLTDEIAQVHIKQRFLGWVSRGTAIRPLTGLLSARDIDWLLNRGQEQKLWRLQGAKVRNWNWVVTLSPEEQSIYDALLSRLTSLGMAVEASADLVKYFPKRDRIAAGLIQYAIERGEIVELGPGFLLATQNLNKAISVLEELSGSHDEFGVGEVRDRLGTGRKFAVMLLEYLDRVGRTRRNGDVRVLIGIKKQK